jgi:hypothetical protein
MNTLFERNTIAGPANDFALRSAAGNIVRDGAAGQSIQVMLDATSTSTLEDSRGYVWLLIDSDLAATVGPDGSTLELTQASACYAATASGETIGSFAADNAGQITFEQTGVPGETVAFTLTRAACGGDAPAPPYIVFLPHVRR